MLTSSVTMGAPNCGFILSEAPGHYSRENCTVAKGSVLAAGTVIMDTTSGSATAAANAGNVGNGTIGTITVGATAQRGIYQLVITEPGTDVGEFEVRYPDGTLAGQGTVAAAFSGGGLGFTLADGATDFAVGDSFNITVAGFNLATTVDTVLGSDTVTLTAATGLVAGTRYTLVGTGIPARTAMVWQSGLTAKLYNRDTGGPQYATANGTDVAMVITEIGERVVAWVTGDQVKGIIMYNIDATDIDMGVAYIARNAEVNLKNLVYPDGTQAEVITKLKALGIICRD